MSEVAIAVDHISKIYRLYDRPIDRLKEALGIGRKNYSREHYALNDVSFNVLRGETIGIIGENGAGKSTVLKIITGVVSPTSGTITVEGRISALLELGAGFNMEYSGIENIYLNGAMIGFSKEEIDRKLNDILSFADIGDFVYQPVKTYSSGMFVRLAFAVAINIEPEILIVDEALSVGDAFFQVKCYHKFEEFKKQGKTIIFVTHDLSSVNRYCDRVVLLNKGQKLAEGKPREMIDLYKRVMAGEENPLEDRSYDGDGDAPQTGGRREPDKGSADLAATAAGEPWKQQMEENPYSSSYGTGAAKIIDYCVQDHTGRVTNVLNTGETYTIRVRVRFNQALSEPVHAVTIRNKQGTEVCGTNTMYEDINTGNVAEGDEQIVSFTQRMTLKGGEYMVCLGCVGFNAGEFEVYHRLYEICLIHVVSEKDAVGFFDMESSIVCADVRKAGEQTGEGGYIP